MEFTKFERQGPDSFPVVAYRATAADGRPVNVIVSHLRDTEFANWMMGASKETAVAASILVDGDPSLPSTVARYVERAIRIPDAVVWFRCDSAEVAERVVPCLSTRGKLTIQHQDQRL